MSTEVEPTSTDFPEVLRRPRVWTVWATYVFAFVLVLAVQVLFGAGLAIYMLGQGTAPEKLGEAIPGMITQPLFFIILIVIGPGSFGLAALAAAYASPEPWKSRLAFRSSSLPMTIMLSIVVGSFFPTAIGLGLAGLLMEYVPGLPTDSSAVDFYNNLTIEWSIPFVILIGLVPGFCEEMLFRGYIQQRLVERWRPLIGITITSVLFGLAHLMPAIVLMATVIGFYLGYVSWKTKSIWPTIFCHIAINSGINLYRAIAKFAELPESTQRAVEYGTVAISFVCFLIALKYLMTQPIVDANEKLSVIN